MKAINDYCNILLIEDNLAQAHLFEEANEAGPQKAKVHLVADGEAALRFLKDGSEQFTKPDIIFLDLHLPKTRGHEVLKTIKDDPQLKRIPVIILTSSNRDKDIEEAYAFNANCYVQKPLNFEEFVNLIQSIKRFWFKN
jgi:two-component system response regulator